MLKAKNPLQVNGTTYKVVRSIISKNVRYTRSSYRGKEIDSQHFMDTGFRICLKSKIQ